MVLTTSTVLHPALSVPEIVGLAHAIDSIVVVNTVGTVVRLLEVDVERLPVVNVPNRVDVGAVWQPDMVVASENERGRKKGVHHTPGLGGY